VELRVVLPEDEVPITIREVVSALKKAGLEVRHDKQNWGDWLILQGHQTVISIESRNGLTTEATIEGAEGEEAVREKVVAGFRKLGWSGEDEDGRYPL